MASPLYIWPWGVGRWATVPETTVLGCVSRFCSSVLWSGECSLSKVCCLSKQTYSSLLGTRWEQRYHPMPTHCLWRRPSFAGLKLVPPSNAFSSHCQHWCFFFMIPDFSSSLYINVLWPSSLLQFSCHVFLKERLSCEKNTALAICLWLPTLISHFIFFSTESCLNCWTHLLTSQLQTSVLEDGRHAQWRALHLSTGAVQQHSCSRGAREVPQSWKCTKSRWFHGLSDTCTWAPHLCSCLIIVC